jgi:predicted nicotinamide N-methyase
MLAIFAAADVSELLGDDESKCDMDSAMIETLEKRATPWLVSLLRSPPTPPELEDQFLNSISNTIANLCGKTAQTSKISSFNFSKSGLINIKESNYGDAGIGFQTWTAGILLAKIIDDEEIEVYGKNILEIGSGTGISGLICGKKGAAITYMTDYRIYFQLNLDDTVLKNIEENIKLNKLNHNTKCEKLDFRECISNPTKCILETDFPILIAADVVFDYSHSEWIPKAAKTYISKSIGARFHIVTPYRLGFRDEVLMFEQIMLESGWKIENSRLIERYDVIFRYTVYSLE